MTPEIITRNKILLNWILSIVLIALILIPRLPALDTFVTVDESTWLMRSANFYYALGQREFEETIYAYHPAVTTMWTGAAAMMVDFPTYRGLGQGYFEKEWQFSDFLHNHGYDPLEMLKTSRLITVGINTGLLIAIFYLLYRLLGWFPAFAATLFLAFEPFLLGHTRILAHEGMMSLLLIVSILAFLIFLYNNKHSWAFLILSGITASLSVLTKSSATIIFPFIGLICATDGINKIRNTTQRWISEIGEQIKRLGIAWSIWLFVAIFSFVLFWPGMWVNPGKMLTEVYGNALSYAFQGYNLEVAGEIGTTEIEETISSPKDASGFQKYLNDIPWHTTPMTWLGLTIVVILFIIKRCGLPRNAKNVILIFLTFAILFFLMMSFAKGRHTPRYIMVTYTCLSLIAGIGIGLLLSRMHNWLPRKFRLLIPGAVLAGLLTIQIVYAFKFFPYYFNYSNPLLEQTHDGIQTPVIGYGEGLELAAAYLAEKPKAKDLTVMSWYGIGPFSFFFLGETENLYPSATWTPGLIERLERSDYLVVYQYHQQQRNMPAKLLVDIANISPEHSIWINSVEYIRIYRVSDLPTNVYIPDQLETP